MASHGKEEVQIQIKLKIYALTLSTKDYAIDYVYKRPRIGRI